MFSIEIEIEKDKLMYSCPVLKEDGKFLCFFDKRAGFNTWRLVFGGEAIPRLKELGMLREDEVWLEKYTRKGGEVIV